LYKFDTGRNELAKKRKQDLKKRKRKGRRVQKINNSGNVGKRMVQTQNKEQKRG